MCAWRVPDRRFGTFVVPVELAIDGYAERRLWNLALPRTWRKLVDRPLAEVAYAQWADLSQAIDSGRNASEAPSASMTVHLEDVLQDPAGELARLCHELGLRQPSHISRRALEITGRQINLLSSGGVGKWRDEAAEEITPLLPRIAALAPIQGYRVDERTGDLEILR